RRRAGTSRIRRGSDRARGGQCGRRQPARELADMTRAPIAAAPGSGDLPDVGDKARVVEAMFDRIAPRYDMLNRVLTFRMDVAWRRTAVAALGLEPGARVMDLACGTGDLCRTLRAAGLEPIGVDFSAGMLGAAHADAPLVRADA